MLRILGLILLILLLGAKTANPATEPPAAERVKFRTEAAAAGEYISLQDLAELPPELAQSCGQVRVWTAPPPGQVYTLTREFLGYRLHQLGLAGLVEGSAVPAAIHVRQSGELITKEQIAAAFRGYILKHGHWPKEQLRVEVMPLEEPVIVPDKEVILEVLPGKSGPLTGDVTLEMALTRNGQIYKRFQVAGRVALEQAVVCAVKPLAASAVLGPDDVRVQPREITGLRSGDYFVSPDQVLGRVLSRSVGPQEMLTPRHLSQQPVINRGDEVTVVLDDHGLAVTTKGVAREPGYAGRFIRILNPKSKREFQAKVVDAKTVQVTL
ncbi:MAG: flagellar basal body P-ring formation chaperone FlgA [Deltaproteobacteria bacterium]|nr:flagellar basal body P-ring formation chaperone FlgA [Deltaproteobacteria bacterium]